MSKDKENKLDNMVNTAMRNLNDLIDVNTVVGKPITTMDGSIIIPISKVTMGFMTGGGEYGDVKCLKYDDCFPFAGGSGAVLSMKPAGFLIDRGEGLKLVTVSNDPYEKLFDTAAEFISNYKEKKQDERDY